MQSRSVKGPHREFGQNWIPCLSFVVDVWTDCSGSVFKEVVNLQRIPPEYCSTYSSSSCSFATCCPVPVSHIQKSL